MCITNCSQIAKDMEMVGQV